ncbi:DUF3784 domain-containing protein [Halorubrum aethiopicum]|uniref:DUF3784 domain-containing protein n=1 Tax=Halorubrum aethiopicum TaxID=1758255 RepID=UPI00082E7F1F|nr:DUF3784 domain-containing protein [Halorubrum aethiopicum]
MLGLPSPSVEWIAVGCLVAVAGWLIRFRGWTFLLAGYDGTSSVPDEVVAETAGNTVLRIGLAGIAIGVVVALVDPPAFLPAVYAAAVVFAVARLIYRFHTYAPAKAA